MPLYTYRCKGCGRTETAFRKIDARDLLPPLCNCNPEIAPFEYGMERIIEAPMVAPDIGAYQAVAIDVATGKPPVITAAAHTASSFSAMAIPRSATSASVASRAKCAVISICARN